MLSVRHLWRTVSRTSARKARSHVAAHERPHGLNAIIQSARPDEAAAHTNGTREDRDFKARSRSLRRGQASYKAKP